MAPENAFMATSVRSIIAEYTLSFPSVFDLLRY